MFRMCKILEICKYNLRNEEGTMVVELAVIIPIIWIIVMWCIIFFFFFLDMGSLKSEGMRCANEVARTWGEEDAPSIEEVRSTFRNNMDNKLILAKLQKESVSISFGTVYVRTDIGFRLAGKSFSFSNCLKVALNNREEWMRVLMHDKG